MPVVSVTRAVQSLLLYVSERKINVKEDKKFGKWILRETFEKDLPKNIIWREKSPMQDGSGTNNLTGLFNTIITDDILQIPLISNH